MKQLPVKVTGSALLCPSWLRSRTAVRRQSDRRSPQLSYLSHLSHLNLLSKEMGRRNRRLPCRTIFVMLPRQPRQPRRRLWPSCHGVNLVTHKQREQKPMTPPPQKPWRTCTWQDILNSAPPPFDALLPRDQVVDQWFAQWAPEFGKVSDEYIKYMTGLPRPEEETEELMSRWGGSHAFHFERVYDDLVVYIGKCEDAGWLVQRSKKIWDDFDYSKGDRLDWRLLTHHLEIPVVFSSFPSAARLIERFFPDLSPPFIWNSRQYL